MACGSTPARKVMVVADPCRESAAALQYALSHVVLENDTLILLHVENPNSAWRIPFGTIFRKAQSLPASAGAASMSSSSSSSSEGFGGGGGGGTIDFLEAMKQACGIAQPRLKVRVQRAEMDGKDKASVLLAQSKSHGVDVIVIGQRTTLSNAILGPKRSRSLRGLDTAEYLIENSKCTCVGVQRKANGGYLLNSKTHKNFWLLA
ncbi:uncharacterized protein [Coffea arabica]|uniref:Universal stress protein PHOS32-like n=1 Tax=Coffea arabica TaxID=13443 RepID=A0A6P6WVW9_COFAR|nr:uncharacterized protein LOC113736684 [Coffea arabica]